MSKFLFLIIALTTFNSLIGQPSSRQFDTSEIEQLVTEDLKAKLNINYSIYRAYEYQDKLGTHYLILTENQDANGLKPDYNDSIKAFCLSRNGSDLQLDWQLRDFIFAESETNPIEYSIWFWTKYLSLTDLDNDGIIDPVIIYGTSGMNGTDDGRIKILTYYKGEKRAIRHQNGVHDSERNTQVDKLFYQLPNSARTAVIEIMQRITSDQNGIFPYGWEANMKLGKLHFDEN
ncbi:M949_RS01915 family surface polysaccharide biosynthesis protein [Marinoscillum pacificum]|uniref:M949_RS01915 family surface polysaccharide biosynthesis protein n=1 Tax=Marinoscillum pacificum TaxID=392723 RepID=UPI002157B414|nr:hypothetical protein [Marinoscillum pacificum]